MIKSRSVPVALTIAGSDSGGGAGIQADLKAFARCGVHGTSAITAVTAQNTCEVTAFESISPDLIRKQIAAVTTDFKVDAVKVGMLADVETVEAVAGALDLLQPGTPIVVDPVMVAESGAQLLAVSAVQALKELVLPKATVLTPNVPEAEVLVGKKLSVEESVKAVHALGPKVTVLTGGHREQAVDIYFDGSETVEIPGERYPDGCAHGSGCTHSSTLAASLALGSSTLEAARRAKSVAAKAVRDGLVGVGAGAGPVDVFGLVSEAPGGVFEPF